MQEKGKHRIWPWGLASVVAVFLIPVLLIVLTFYLDLAAHEAAFDGICGPYAPDIEAYSCDKETYMERYLTGFALLAYGLQWARATAAVLGVTLLAWVVWFVRRGMQRRAGS